MTWLIDLWTHVDLIKSRIWYICFSKYSPIGAFLVILIRQCWWQQIYSNILSESHHFCRQIFTQNLINRPVFLSVSHFDFFMGRHRLHSFSQHLKLRTPTSQQIFTTPALRIYWNKREIPVHMSGCVSKTRSIHTSSFRHHIPEFDCTYSRNDPRVTIHDRAISLRKCTLTKNKLRSKETRIACVTSCTFSGKHCSIRCQFKTSYRIKSKLKRDGSKLQEVLRRWLKDKRWSTRHDKWSREVYIDRIQANCDFTTHMLLQQLSTYPVWDFQAHFSMATEILLKFYL